MSRIRQSSDWPPSPENDQILFIENALCGMEPLGRALGGGARDDIRAVQNRIPKTQDNPSMERHLPIKVTAMVSNMLNVRL